MKKHTYLFPVRHPASLWLRNNINWTLKSQELNVSDLNPKREDMLGVDRLPICDRVKIVHLERIKLKNSVA